MGPRYRELQQRASRMRNNPTRSEQILWGRLRKRRILGYKFRRQHILAPYIVDFYCVSAKLAIEVDGASHLDRRRAAFDHQRETDLRDAHGVRVIRFTSYAVRRHLDGVTATIARHLNASDAPP